MSSDLYVAEYVVAYITFAIGILSLIARFYSRALVIKSWGWDDWASVVVFLINIVQQVVLQLFMNLGCDKYVSGIGSKTWLRLTNDLIRPSNVNCSFASPILIKVDDWTIVH